MKNIKFWKMHGAGNDFILVDDRTGDFPLRNRRWIRRICSRHDGIGSEGLILLRESAQASFNMRFFNPDGSEADMCGNGVRCAARLAYELGIAGKKMTVETQAGILNAFVEKDGVRVTMPLASGIRLLFPVRALGRRYVCSLINTGVPHLVIATGELATIDLPHIGRALRYHRLFAPGGVNVDFMQVAGSRAVAVRTYERGVEAETPACGTGLTACAIVAALLKMVRPPVRVKCRHGDTLEVDFKIEGKEARDVTLLGPAEHVFSGEISYP